MGGAKDIQRWSQGLSRDREAMMVPNPHGRFILYEDRKKIRDAALEEAAAAVEVYLHADAPADSANTLDRIVNYSNATVRLAAGAIRRLKGISGDGDSTPG